MSTKAIILHIDETMLTMLENRAKLENKTLSNMIVSIITTNGCTGCQMFSKENGIRQCGDKEISGFIVRPESNPIPNWCPLINKC